MKCRTRKQGIQVVIDIDGKMIYPSAYMSYYPMQENFEAFKARGITLFMFPVYASDEGINMETGLKPFWDNIWKGYGEYDFSYVDRVLQMIAPEGEDGIYIIPRVCLEPPVWWQKRHPEEVARDYGQEALRECFTSVRWREDMAEVLRALIEHIEASVWKKNVIGYHIAAGGTEEWPYQARYSQQYYDDSEPNLQAYRAFLKKRYQTVENLSAAWGWELQSFEEVQFPRPAARTYAKKGWLRSRERDTEVLDYYTFHNQSVGETICYFCRKVKEFTNGERLAGAFYGYVLTIPKNKKGLHAMECVLKSPDVDFLSSTNWEMDPGQAWCFASATDSAALHNKLWIAEGDIRTYRSTSLAEQMPWAVPDNDYYASGVWKGPGTPALSCSALTKALARILTAPCGIWWFDMWGKWFDSPEMLQIIEKTVPLLKRQTYNYFPAQIAILVDEKGHKYCGLDENEIAEVFHELIRGLVHMGAPFHIYLLSDIKEKNFPDEAYKLFIFAAATDPDPEEKRAVADKCKQGQKTLLWLHTSSCYDEELCGFSLTKEEYLAVHRAGFKQTEYPRNLIPTLQFAKEEGYVLSRFTDDLKPALLWKEQKEYNTVYALHLALPAELLRHIALLSGIHCYNREGDCIYAGGEYLAIHAVQEGCRRICLPSSDFEIRDALNGEFLKTNDLFVEIRMKQYETRLLHATKVL